MEYVCFDFLSSKFVHYSMKNYIYFWVCMKHYILFAWCLSQFHLRNKQQKIPDGGGGELVEDGQIRQRNVQQIIK